MPAGENVETGRGGSLKIQGIRRSFGAHCALNGVSLEIRAGEFFSLLGPSGCGKTTLLRIIAGLDAPDAGTILLDGEDLLKLPAHLRPVNTVFQSYALFPHLNVEENVGFGLRMKRVAATQMRETVKQMMLLVRVEKFAKRKPHDLSGGQRQRVALARALANRPRLLLLDEPLAAVDQQLRGELQDELRRLQRETGITFVYVTHDQEEALRLSDRLAVMRLKEVAQVGAPQDVYDHPANEWVAQFLGWANVCKAEIVDGVARTDFGEIVIASSEPNGAATVYFRPERVMLGDGHLKGRVVAVEFSGQVVHITLHAGRQNIRATTLSHGPLNLAAGEEVFWNVPPEAITICRPALTGDP